MPKQATRKTRSISQRTVDRAGFEITRRVQVKLGLSPHDDEPPIQLLIPAVIETMDEMCREGRLDDRIIGALLFPELAGDDRGLH